MYFIIQCRYDYEGMAFLGYSEKIMIGQKGNEE